MVDCKKQLQPDELMMVMDYSENYSCHFQHEVQSAFFEPTQVTIHPMMLYYKKKIQDQDVTYGVPSPPKINFSTQHPT